VRRLRAALVVACALAAACHRAKPEEVQTDAAVPVEVAEARTGTITAVVTATGTVTAASGGDVTITAPQPARIAQMTGSVGDRVRRGTVVVRFDSPAARTELASRAGELGQAQAQLENARHNYTRLSELLAKGIASRKEVEDAKRQLREAEAAVGQGQRTRAAAADLAARATPVAPFDAVIAERWHGPGDLVDVNEHVVRLVDPRRLEVTAMVAVGDAQRLTPGHAARVIVPGAEADSSLPATVASGAGAADATTGTAAVRLKLGSPLPVGTPVQVEIEAEQRTNTVIVPMAAVVKEEAKTHVYVVGADKKAHRREVLLGLTTPTEAEIVRGVQAGEKVVVKGQDELPDGALVTVEAAGGE
jgi:RND family efflux transporter MFP subunit